jgi:hypothetical protein
MEEEAAAAGGQYAQQPGMYGEEDPALYDDLYYYNEEMGTAEGLNESFDSNEDLFTAENLKQWGGQMGQA